MALDQMPAVMNRTRRIRAAVVVAGLVAAFTGCDRAAPVRGGSGPPILVLAAASTSDAIEELAAVFQRKDGTNVKVNVGPSNALASQIIAGAPADVYLSANAEWADAIRESDLARQTRRLLTNRLVIVVTRGNPAAVKEPADLATGRVRKVALAGENVPVGIYAQQALSAAGLYEPLVERGKIARGHDVRVTLSYVELGEAEAGIVYATDARLSDHVEVASSFPPSSHDQIVYPVVLLKHASGNPAARRFFDFLASRDAKAVFEKYGFTRLDDEPIERQSP